MRVRISYGVEIEEIPDKAQSLGIAAKDSLCSAIELLSRAVDSIEDCENNFSVVINVMEKVRLELNKADLEIADVQAILNGLNDYYNGEQNVSEGRSTVDPSGDLATTTTDSGKG